MGVTELIFELNKGLFNRLYCFYGNHSHHENEHNSFAIDWAFVDTIILLL